MEFKDYYDILGVARDADEADIKKAFRKGARKYHPDISTGAEAEAKFKDINEAYEVLKDPERRAAYDQLGAGFSGEQPYQEPPPGWDQGFSFSHSDMQDQHAFSDFFETLFRRGGGPGMGAQPAADSHARIEIPIEDAFHGASRQLHLRAPVVDPNGQVRLQDRTIAIRVPKGITEGQHIRLAGQGMSGATGAGDLFVEVTFAAHPIYRAEGRDLYLDLPIAPWEAALGQNVVMPTPGGKVDLRLPKNARNGQRMRLKGKGLPGHPPGNIYATLKIVNPNVDTDEARDFFERMAKELPFDPRSSLGG